MKSSALLLALLFSVFSVWAQESKPESKPESEKPPVEAPEKPAPTKQVERSSIQIAPPIAREQILNADLKKFTNEKEQLNLLAGPDEFFVLKLGEKTSSPKGVAILLPDWHQHAAGPKAINELRKALPQKGWVSFAVQPPPAPEQFIVAEVKAEAVVATDSPTSADEQLPTDPLSQYKQQLTQIMKKVMESAEEYPGIHLVIAEGITGALLTELYRDRSIQAPNALILLSAYLPDISANNDFVERMAKSDYPVLDLVLSRDNHWVKQSQLLRKQLAKKHIKVVYRQQELSNSQPGYYPIAELNRAILGWLNAIGW